MHDLGDFHLSDLVRLDGLIRSAAAPSATMEQAASSVVRTLVEELRDPASGERSCVLVRLFTTLPLQRLEPALRPVARAEMPSELASTDDVEEVRCLTLLATVGTEPAWNSRRQSLAHRAVPLPSPEAVRRMPMIRALLDQLGVEVDGLGWSPASDLRRARRAGDLQVLHVPEALGSPTVPAQEDFVVPYRVRSVLGFGGVLPDGELFATICFTRTPVPRATAEMFSAVASSVGLALLPHVGSRVFDSDPPVAVRSPGTEEAWRSAALGRLLEAHESGVLEHSLRLEEALSSLEDRATELEGTRAAAARGEALTSAMLASSLDAVVSMAADGTVIEWSPAAERMFGWSRPDALGQPLAELLIPPFHREAHRRGLAHYLATGESRILGRRIEIEAVDVSGRTVPVELSVSRAPTGGPPVFTAFLRDITAQREAEQQREALLASEREARASAEGSAQQLLRLYQLTTALGEAVTAADVARTTLAVVLEMVGGSTGSLWVPDEPGQRLVVLHSVGGAIGLARLGSIDLSAAQPVTGVWREGTAAWIPSRERGLQDYPQWPAQDSEAESFAVLPLSTDRGGVGVLVVGFEAPRGFPDSEQQFLNAAAGQCAQALDRAHLRDLEAASSRRLAFLAEAGRTLGTTLEHSATLQHITELSVGVLGHLCVVHLLDPDTHRLAQVAFAHEEPDKATALDRLRDYQPPPDSPLDVVMRTGTTLQVPPLSADQLRSVTNSDEEYEVAATLSLGPLLIVPLTTRGSTIGTLTVGRPPDSPAYGPELMALAEALAERAASAIDNSRAHTARTAVAETLQRSMMSTDLPTVAGLRVGSRYQPGTAGTEVGGDWFDLLALPGGRAAVVIGDVMGRGVRAAAVMGQLRAAVRAYASLDLPPDVLMGQLDELVRGLREGSLVTCCYAVIDPAARTLRACTSGHVPPVLVTADGAHSLDLPPNVPLGVGGVPFAPLAIDLPDESVLLLYTDGLVESRERDVQTGIDELCARLVGAGGDLDALCEQVLRAMTGDAADDDVALLAVAVERPHDRLRWRA